MEKSTFNLFIKAICKHFAQRQILVGSEIYDTIIAMDNESKSNFTFIKCDLLKDRVIVFSNAYPLSNKAILIEDIIAFNEYIDSVKSPMIAFTNALDANNITIRNIDGKMTMLQIGDGEIKSQYSF